MLAAIDYRYIATLTNCVVGITIGIRVSAEPKLKWSAELAKHLSGNWWLGLLPTGGGHRMWYGNLRAKGQWSLTSNTAIPFNPGHVYIGRREYNTEAIANRKERIEKIKLRKWYCLTFPFIYDVSWKMCFARLSLAKCWVVSMQGGCITEMVQSLIDVCQKNEVSPLAI